MPSRADIHKAKQLVQQVILEQKNTYIKELLRKYEIPGGVTKKDFEERLYDAIEDGSIPLDGLQQWIDETEGWGDEHVYLYRVPSTICAEIADRAEQCVKRAKLDHLWNAAPSLAFSDERRLVGVSFADEQLRFVWHQDTELVERAKEKDKPAQEEEDGWWYSYKAYRHSRLRSVTRIVVRPGRKLAAVFLPGSSEPSTHGDERAVLSKEIGKAFQLDACALCEVDGAVKRIDKEIAKGRIPLESRHTRLKDKDGAGYVDIVSTSKTSYTQSTTLLSVRKAMSDRDFSGSGAKFFFKLQTGAAFHNVRVDLFDDYQRIRMYVKLSRNEVWDILDLIERYM